MWWPMDRRVADGGQSYGQWRLKLWPMAQSLANGGRNGGQWLKVVAKAVANGQEWGRG